MQSLVSIRFVTRCFVLSALVTAVPHSLAAQQKPKLRPLHIALANNSATMSHIYVAKHLGIFEKYGYDARVLVERDQTDTNG